jgi:hypothetical protein
MKTKLDCLLNKKIVGYVLKDQKKTLRLSLFDGTDVSIELDDDSAGGNNSCAFFSNVCLAAIFSRNIVSVEESGKNSYGAKFIFTSDDGYRGEVDVTHNHNGYYGWGFFVSVRSEGLEENFSGK